MGSFLRSPRVPSFLPRGLLAVGLLALAAGCPRPPPAAPSWSEAFDASSVGWLMNVAALPGGGLLAVGGRPDAGLLMRREPEGSWHPVELGLTVPLLNWTHGLAADDVWGVGNAGTLLHGNGASWMLAASPTAQDLWGVWGAASDDVWAVGGNGRSTDEPVLLHWDGASWTSVPLPPLERARVHALYKVWGTARDDVWVVGQRGLLLHWDGASWTEHLSGTSEDLISLWGTSSQHIVAVGGRGNAVVCLWNGQTWSSHPLSRLPGLNGVWMRSPATAHVVGVDGTLVRLDVASMSYEAAPRTTRLSFHSVTGDGQGHLVAVGGNLFENSGLFQGLAWTRTLTDSE